MSLVQAFHGSGSENGQVAVDWWAVGVVQCGQRKDKSLTAQSAKCFGLLWRLCALRSPYLGI